MTNTAISGPAPIAVYLYAGDQIIENVTTGYLYFQDSLGNTSHVTDSAGNLKESYTYTAFGIPTFYDATGHPRITSYDPAGNPITASAIGIRHLFQGQLWTQETWLNDYRNRVELPTMGVFMQPDPIGFKGDAANVYRFCNNNAVNRTDPMGLYIVRVIDFDPGMLSARSFSGADGGGTAEHAEPADSRENGGPTVRIENTAVWRTWDDYAHSDSKRDDEHYGDHKGKWLEGPERITGHAFVKEDGTVCPVVDTQHARLYAPGKEFGPRWKALGISGAREHEQEISAAMSSRRTLERAQNAFTRGGIQELRNEMTRAMSEAVINSSTHDGPNGNHHLLGPQKQSFPYNREPIPYSQ